MSRNPTRFPVLPGGTLGILGGGQLGKMTAQAAQRLGYRVHCYDASAQAPAFAVAHAHSVGAFDDAAALARFAAGCDVVTYEFENLGATQLLAIEEAVPLRPSASVLSICQNRMREKQWLRSKGMPHVPFEEVADVAGLEAAVAELGFPSVLKTADFGYDGKGQMKLTSAADLPKAREEVARGGRRVLEAWVPFAAEVSAIAARDAHGACEVFPVSENIHTHHILDLSIVPARVDARVVAEAETVARRIANEMEVIGLIAVEFFVTKSGEVLVNEMAPRPHNSGHYSIEGCLVSQFEQHVRAVCGLPLARPELRCGGVAMANLLGDAWARGTPDWAAVLREPDASLHLYGKGDPRPGRKMGHVTVCLSSPFAAMEKAARMRDLLNQTPTP